MSIDGDYSNNLLKRFEYEVIPRIIEEETFIIIAIGINDCCFMKGKNKTDEDFDLFGKNISGLIELSLRLSAKPLFLGMAPVDEEKTNPVSWSKIGVCCKNEYIKK